MLKSDVKVKCNNIEPLNYCKMPHNGEKSIPTFSSQLTSLFYCSVYKNLSERICDTFDDFSLFLCSVMISLFLKTFFCMLLMMPWHTIVSSQAEKAEDRVLFFLATILSGSSVLLSKSSCMYLSTSTIPTAVGLVREVNLLILVSKSSHKLELALGMEEDFKFELAWEFGGIYLFLLASLLKKLFSLNFQGLLWFYSCLKIHIS